MRRRANAGSGVVLVVAGVAALAATVMLARQRASNDAGARQQAAEMARAIDQSVSALRAEVSQDVEMASDIPQLRSALGNRADADTFIDLFKNEDWWDRYRGLATAILVDGDVLVTQNVDASVAADGARRALATPGVSLHALESSQEVNLAAIGRYRLARLGITFTLLIGRPVDRVMLEKMRGGPAGALTLSDGHRIRASSGDGELGAVAGTLVGREGEGKFVLDGADWTAAAVPVADKLWVVALAHRPGHAPPFVAVVGCGLAAVALLLIGAFLMLRRTPEAAVAAAQTIQAPAVSDLGAGQAPERVRSSPPALAVVPPPAPRLTPSVVSAPGALAVATAIAAEGGQQFGRYRLIERIGEGGMADVFTALLSGAEGFERLVVIKRLKPHLALNPEAVAQFIDEARLGSVLAHSNIVNVSDFGKVGDGYYLAEEFIDGRTLAQIAARYREKYDRALPAAIVFHVVHEVLAGIGYAHDRMDPQGRPLGIVHRDVSPTNIMVSFEGEVKLLDFGIVKATERVSKTREGNVKGNVGYMSPEQARGLEVSNRSDLFSLGLVMFELLSGEAFYQGAGSGEILYQAATGPTIDHLARIAKLPQPAPDFLRRALAMDVNSRYPSARAFAQDLTPSATMVKGQLAEMMRALFAA